MQIISPKALYIVEIILIFLPYTLPFIELDIN